MKKITTLILAISFKLSSAQETANFENLNLPLNSFWNGSNSTQTGFENGGLYFKTQYDTSSGGYWASGFAYSTMRDTIDGTFTNLYSAKPGTGSSSNTYIVCQKNSILKPIYAGDKMNLISLDITNTTYAAQSMKNGDFFATAFGGITGDVPDFFKLTFKAYVNGLLTADSSEFYLADYRFSNNSQDYIVTNWRSFFPNINNADSVLLTLTSTDSGSLGMNTPAFFCLDNIVSSFPLSISTKEKNNFAVFPNPASNFITVKKINQENEIINIYNSLGELVKSNSSFNEINRIDVSDLPKGIYYVNLSLQNKNQKFIKN